MSKTAKATSNRRSWPPAPEPLPFGVVDNHCHLDHPVHTTEQFDVADAIDRAAQAGVTRIVQVGCDVESSRWAVSAAQQHESIVAAVAIHPNDAARLGEGLADAIAIIDDLAADPAVRAVGETGLDYFRTGPEGHDAQEMSFREHIRIAKKHHRTLVIHDRDAHNDILRVVDDEGAPDRVVMHCFSGDADFATECLSRGFYLSFAGTVTFKNAENLREALLVTPLDRLLVETDAPFLTPEPFRGSPNASYLIPNTIRLMADVRGDDVESLCRAIDSTTDQAFGGTWPARLAPSI